MEEVYEFNVTYPQRNSGGPLLSITKDQTSILQVHTKKEIKKATQQMMRTLLTLTQTLKPLPDNRIITMRLYYYDDVTPVDYQPPLFRGAVDLRLNFKKEDPVKINVGNVDTPYHTFALPLFLFLFASPTSSHPLFLVCFFFSLHSQAQCQDPGER